MRFLLLHSSSTKGGAKRIGEIVGNKIGWDQSSVWPANLQKYNGVILHNRMDMRPGIRCAIYPCGMPTKRIIEDPATQNIIKVKSPRIIWANTYTAEKQLKKCLPSNVEVKFMPKPFPFKIPEVLPTAPKGDATKTILWYWKPNWHYTRAITAEIARLMNELNDFNIYVINNSNNEKNHKIPPGAGSHVVPVGRINIPEWQDKFIGVVRASQGLDFGRSTYQFQAYGKWVIYTNMDEPHVTCAQRHRHIPVLVRRLQNNWTEENRQAAWKYISTGFSEEGLQKLWVDELRRVFKS